MPGDPQQWREQARECIRSARHSRSSLDRENLAVLATKWLQLAAIYESDNALLERWGDRFSNVISPRLSLNCDLKGSLTPG